MWHSTAAFRQAGNNVRRTVRETGFYPLRAIELRDITHAGSFRPERSSQ